MTIKPLVTVAQFAQQYTTMEAGQTRKTIVYYAHRGVDYHSAISLFKSIDDQRFIMCGCGCAVRQLTHFDDRPGLCCIDCLMRERRKDDNAPIQVKPKVATPAQVVKRKPVARRKARKAA